MKTLRKIDIAIIVLSLFCIASTFHVKAQNDTLYLNLETILEVGGANNLLIEQYRKEQKLAEADLAKAREWWLPEIYGDIKGHKLWGAAMNTDGGFFLDVNRGNMWTDLGIDAHWDFGEGIYQTQSAQLRAKAQMHQTEAKRNEVLLETIHAYYEFLAAQLYNRAYDQMAKQSDTIVDQLQIQVEAGIRYESEMLLSKSNRNHLKVKRLEAQKEFLKAKAKLANLLNADPGVVLVGTDQLLTTIDIVPQSQWKNTGTDSSFIERPEYEFLSTRLQVLETERKSTTTGLLLPELRIATNSGYFGGLFQEVRPMEPIAYPNPQVLYPTTRLNASLMWRIPIGRLTYKGRLKQYDAKMEIQENKINQFENQVNEEVSQARAELFSANEQLELAHESQELAKQAVEQSIERQKMGTAKPFEVFQAQEFYLRARLDYLKAIADYNKAQYSYYVAVGNDL